MNKIETFEKFLSQSNLTSLPIEDFFINLIIGTLMSLLIMFTYLKCGTSISNRRELSNQFPLLLLITLFIITIVKSSLALSLGLVGALSIVRFRTAIKEPNELLYLFLCIAFGLGLGANQRIISIIAFVFIISFIWIYYSLFRLEKTNKQNMILTITNNDETKPNLELIIELLKTHSSLASLIRVDESKNHIDAHFNVEFYGIDELNSFRNSMLSKFQNVKITILDNQSLV